MRYIQRHRARKKEGRVRRLKSERENDMEASDMERRPPCPLNGNAHIKAYKSFTIQRTTRRRSVTSRRTTHGRTTVTIEKDVLEKARSTGINISAFLEIKLHEYLALLEGKTNGGGHPPASNSDVKQSPDSKTSAVGFEPTTAGLEGQRPVQARPRAPVGW